MEIVFPVSMLVIGLVVGTVSSGLSPERSLNTNSNAAGLKVRPNAHADRASRRKGKPTPGACPLATRAWTDARQSLRASNRLEEERKASQDKLTLLNNAEEKLADAFKALSADALRNNNQSFLDLAKQNLETFQQTAKGDLERRQSAIDD